MTNLCFIIDVCLHLFKYEVEFLSNFKVQKLSVNVQLDILIIGLALGVNLRRIKILKIGFLHGVKMIKF